MADETERPQKRARLETTASLQADVSSAAPIAPVDPVALSDLDREVRAGITEYVCPNNLGFAGTLKQRYSDFLVNEIGLDGKVVHLRTLGTGNGEKEKLEKKGELIVGKEGVEKLSKSGGSNGTVEVKNAASDEAKKDRNEVELNEEASEEQENPFQVRSKNVCNCYIPQALCVGI